MQQKNNQLKRNHYIPKFMINYWKTKGEKYDGVFVYDIRENKEYFANSNGGNAFPFAIAKDLYVPNINDFRSTGLEEWFSAQESALASFIRQATTRSEQISVNTQADITKLTMAILGLECRSRYNIELLKKYIIQNSEKKSIISNNPERDEHRLILENIIHFVTELTGRFFPIEITFCHTKKNVVLSDRPFINDNKLEQRFIALTSNCFICYEKSKNNTLSYRHTNVSDGFVDTINKQLLLNARDWIVTKDRTQLMECILVQKSKEWADSKDSDFNNIEVIPVEKMTSSWSIKESNT